MPELPEVKTAKALMAEAMKWSVMKWLREKKRVRKTADQANAVLDHLADTIKQQWPDNVRTAYETLSASPNRTYSGKRENPEQPSNNGAAARKMKQADDEAYRARMDAEETFDQAERILSTSMAREGCLKAIRSWELKERAIRLAEEIAYPEKS